MIVSNHQKDIAYFKQYPCYSITSHLSEHRQFQFSNVPYIQFSKQTHPKIDLPKYYIDKYQTPQQMYWLQWRMENVPEQVITEGKKTKLNDFRDSSLSLSFSDKQNSTNKSSCRSRRCLYISLLGKMPHIKLVFNYDPQKVSICRDYLYTIGGNQLIITELWPQNMVSTRNISSSEQLPPKQVQIIHKLQSLSQILSMDFVFSQSQDAICKILYFHQKKGYFSQTYSRKSQSSNSIISKILDLPSMFKKNEVGPLYFETLIPNILGLIINNKKQFSLINLTDMKVILNTHRSLQSWQLDPNQPILIRNYQNKPHEGYNDCLTISIGQGSSIEIFLYHLRFIQNAFLNSPVTGQKRPASEVTIQINSFTASCFIDFQNSKLKHFMVINLQQLTYLHHYILAKNGIIFVGYCKNVSTTNYTQSDQLPICGFIDYFSPYVTHQILLQQNKIWKQYKYDFLFYNKHREEKIAHGFDYSEDFQRILAPGRYQKWFILKALRLNKISELKQYLEKDPKHFQQISQRLSFEWRNQFKLIELVIFKEEVLIIRSNSIGSMTSISEQQFSLQKDPHSQLQISYNQLQSRSFQAQHDIQGDRMMDVELNLFQSKQEGEIYAKDTLFRNNKTYEQKVKIISNMVESYLQNGYFEHGLEDEKKIGIGGYYDQELMKKGNKLYKRTIGKILSLSGASSLQPLPDLSNQQILPQSQQQIEPVPEVNQLHMHLSVLSLKVKQQLVFDIHCLKANYQYYFQSLMNQAQGQPISSAISSQKQTITAQMLQKVHLRHLYVISVLQWIVKVGFKYHLEKMHELWDGDLIDEFVRQYINKYYHSAGQGVCDSNRYALSNGQLFKSDIQVHLNNVLSLLFRGLIQQFNVKNTNQNISQLIELQSASTNPKRIQSLIHELNNKKNPFILMLLAKNQMYQKYSDFITKDLLPCFFTPLVIEPLHSNLTDFVPKNKTFIYSILNLHLSEQEKKGILSQYLRSKQFLSLLLLIQSQNNCYLNQSEQDQNELLSNANQFYENTLRLDRQNCCIIQSLILGNYQLFLQSTKNDASSLIYKQAALCSEISSPQYQKQLYQTQQENYAKFIDVYFSKIQFMYLSAASSHRNKNKQMNQIQNGQNYKQENLVEIKHSLVEEKHSIYDQKETIQANRKLIEKVQQINQNRVQNRGSKIQRLFQKYYDKIYKPKTQNSSKPGFKQTPYNSQGKSYVSSQIYPQMTGLGYNLSMWQLQKIGRLYQKQKKILKQQMKHQRTQTIQKVLSLLNLEYSMIKIYLYRLKRSMKQISTLTQEQKQSYTRIMQYCVEGLKQSIKMFKQMIGRLGGQQQIDIKDSEILQWLKETDTMQHSRVWDKESDEFYSQSTAEMNDEQDQNDQKWSILGNLSLKLFTGKPITIKWLQLLQLTFKNQQSQNALQSYNINRSLTFTNYQSKESILMKILRTIKQQNLDPKQNTYKKSLDQIFGSEYIERIIDGNQHLKSLYRVNYSDKSMKLGSNSRNNYNNRGLFDGFSKSRQTPTKY